MSSSFVVNTWLQDAVEASVIAAVETRLTERAMSGLPAEARPRAYASMNAEDGEPKVSWSVYYDDLRPRRSRSQSGQIYINGEFSVTPRDCVRCLLEGLAPEGVPSAETLFKRGQSQ